MATVKDLINFFKKEGGFIEVHDKRMNRGLIYKLEDVSDNEGEKFLYGEYGHDRFHVLRVFNIKKIFEKVDYYEVETDLLGTIYFHSVISKDLLKLKKKLAKKREEGLLF